MSIAWSFNRIIPASSACSAYPQVITQVPFPIPTTAPGYRRQQLLAARTGYVIFEQELEKVRQRHGFVVAGYVVMPEHVHLLVTEPKKCLLSKAIQALKLSVAVQSRERHFRQARYDDFNRFTIHKHTEKLKYIHRNPVTRGLVEKPEDWTWSSYRHYSTGEIGSVEIESWWTSTRRVSGLAETHVSEARCGAPPSLFEEEK